jgi:hypothetical protein
VPIYRVPIITRRQRIALNYHYNHTFRQLLPSCVAAVLYCTACILTDRLGQLLELNRNILPTATSWLLREAYRIGLNSFTLLNVYAGRSVKALKYKVYCHKVLEPLK